MEVRLVYDIKDLKCQYASGHYPVLEIDALQLHKGTVYYFIGASGVGKSTLLETLGMMNNTILHSADTVLDFYSSGSKVSLAELWGQREVDLARFRKNNLSFIFQNTNLFENLTAYENAQISPIISGLENSKAKKIADDLLLKLFEKKFVKTIKGGRTVQKMSGGERQRLSFVRAFGSSFEALFADEPTGNLDHHRAHRLAKLITDHVHNNKKMAVVVSHDINLALAHADVIVVIEKVEKIEGGGNRLYGRIGRGSLYEKLDEANWKDSVGKSITISTLKEDLLRAIR